MKNIFNLLMSVVVVTLVAQQVVAGDSDPISTPVPDPSNPVSPIENEAVKVNINFINFACFNSGNGKNCSGVAIPPKSQTIVLKKEMNSCGLSPIGPKFRTPNEGGSGPEDCITWRSEKTGHWIDFDNSPIGNRYIGIFNVSKFSVKDSSSDPNKVRSYYDITIEVLGKNKTVAKVTGQLTSWDQLQPIMILVEDHEDSYMTSEMNLDIRPSFDPGVMINNHMHVGSSLPPMEWKVIQGKIAPIKN